MPVIIRFSILLAGLVFLATGCQDQAVPQSKPQPVPKPVDHTPQLLKELSATQDEVVTLTSVNSMLGVGIVILGAGLAVSLAYKSRKGGGG